MCGRFSLFAPPWGVEERFDASFEYPFERRYNAAPSQPLPVITDESPEGICAFTWGLVPPWADDRTDGGLINARAETLADTPSFRTAVAGYDDASGRDEAAGRCLVLADGFYEWAETEAGKRPYRITRCDGEPFAMAGLWTRWRPPTVQTGIGEFGGGADGSADDGDFLETFAIVTTEPNEVVGELHDRMPVILPADAEREWLEADPDAATDLIGPSPAAELRAYRVSPAVNDPSNDGPAVVEAVEADG